MANNPLEIIAAKKDKIKENEMDTTLLYEELGRCVSEIAKYKQINYCESLITGFTLANDEYLKLKRTQEKFTNIAKNSTSLEKELRIVRRNINDNEKKIKDLLLRIGAATYESYCSNILTSDLMKLLYPIFDSKQRRISLFENKLKNANTELSQKYYKSRLVKLRFSLIDVFYQTALLIEKNDFIESIPLKNRDAILNEYSQLKHKASELTYSLKIYKSELDTLKKDNALDVDSKLGELKGTVNEANENSKNAAIVLGDELYKKLPNNISSHDIGENAIDLIDQITLHKSMINNLNKDIELLKNELKISEIKLQIQEEKSNINRLKVQIKSCNDKINAIEYSIEEKNEKIDELVKEGVYIDEE